MTKIVAVVITVVITVSLCVIATVFIWREFRRPLFHDHFGAHKEAFIPYWVPNMAIEDARGTIAFHDEPLNMFVVIQTFDRNTNTRMICSSRSAVLLRGTPHEIKVDVEPNTLLLVSKGRQTRFPLDPGTTSIWYDELYNIQVDKEADLVAEIAQRYGGEDGAKIMEFFSESATTKTK